MNKKTFSWLLIVLLGMQLSACVSDQPYWSEESASPLPAVERIAYQQDGQEVAGAYWLGVVEFDDQGWYHDQKQEKALFGKLAELSAGKKPLLIVAYTHGWKHNGKADDSNLISFRELLKDIDRIERLAKTARHEIPRTVVGVYVGWRGASSAVPVLDNLTFWNRKNAAERVGSRSLKQLFTRLNNFRAYNNGGIPNQLANSDETQLVLIGHSFGGLVTYHAIHSQLIERALEVNERGDYRTAKSYGDFVLLVNPAFEGAAYHPIWEAAQTRKCFPPGQRPIMAIVTSKTDMATKMAFPAGRLYTLTQPAPQPGQRETVMHTVGHLRLYQTHELNPSKSTTTIGQKASPTEVNRQLNTQTSMPTEEPVIQFSDSRLVKVETTAPTYMPYLVISADPEIIDGHNAFWNARFTNFMVEFLARQVIAPRPVAEPGTPCPAWEQKTGKQEPQR